MTAIRINNQFINPRQIIQVEVKDNEVWMFTALGKIVKSFNSHEDAKEFENDLIGKW